MNFYWTLMFFGIGHAKRHQAPLHEPTMIATSNGAHLIPNAYIVRLKTTQCAVETDAMQCRQNTLKAHVAWLTSLLGSQGHALNHDDTNNDEKGAVKHVYEAGDFHGYAGKFDAATLDKIRARSDVDYVERDSVVHIADVEHLKPGTEQERALYRALVKKASPMGGSSAEDDNEMSQMDLMWGKRAIQRNAPWGLCRLSNHKLPRVFKRYSYPRSAGEGIDAYVVDTGINVEHIDFEGRAVWGATIPDGDEDIDGNGHGTHVAGTIGGRLYGVAKRARPIAVKVLRTSGFGSNSDVIKGVEWVIQRHKSKRAKDSPFKGSVANMSLGGGKSTALEDMVDDAVRAGVHFAVAAGNDGSDACEYSPAGARLPLTVGATDREDRMASFSNHGKCVDIFGPGVQIVSAWIGSPYAVNTISGTSMATPHIAGVLALHASELFDAATGTLADPIKVKELVMAKSSKGMITGIPEEVRADTPNALVNTEHLLMSKKAAWSQAVRKALAVHMPAKVLEEAVKMSENQVMVA